MAQNYNSKAIGRQLGLSPSTVNNHIHAALQTLGLTDRYEAARLLSASRPRRPRQQLPRQPRVIADVAVAVETSQTIGGRLGRWFVGRFPPIGGPTNDLNLRQRWMAIANLYFFSVIVFVTAIIVIKASIRLLS